MDYAVLQKCFLINLFEKKNVNVHLFHVRMIHCVRRDEWGALCELFGMWLPFSITAWLHTSLHDNNSVLSLHREVSLLAKQLHDTHAALLLSDMCLRKHSFPVTLYTRTSLRRPVICLSLPFAVSSGNFIRSPPWTCNIVPAVFNFYTNIWMEIFAGGFQTPNCVMRRPVTCLSLPLPSLLTILYVLLHGHATLFPLFSNSSRRSEWKTGTPL